MHGGRASEEGRRRGRLHLEREKEVLLTREGLRKLEKELEALKTVKRREVAARIKQALEFGDITENSEYDDAKNEQAFVEGRIATLERMLRNARVVDESDVQEGVVSLGCWVRLKDVETGEELEYMVVGSAEADPLEGRISNESPVGQALMGKPAGTVVTVQAPDGLLRYEILGISLGPVRNASEAEPDRVSS